MSRNSDSNSKCPYYTESELKNFKSMLVDCIWHKQFNGYSHDCKYCLEHTYQRTKQIEYYQTKTRNSI